MFSLCIICYSEVGSNEDEWEVKNMIEKFIIEILEAEVKVEDLFKIGNNAPMCCWD